MPDKLFNAGRLQEIKAGEFAPEVYTVDPVAAALAQGLFFVAGSGRFTLTAAGNIRAVVENPPGSARNVFVARLEAQATAQAWASLFINPTAGVPTSAPRRNNNAVLASSSPAVAVVRADPSATAPLGGGTDTGIVVGLPQNSLVKLELPPLLLSPGVTFGINIPLAVAADLSLFVYWWEEPT